MLTSLIAMEHDIMWLPRASHAIRRALSISAVFPFYNYLSLSSGS